MMIIRLAWKNIWRNKVRSGVILGAIAVGLFAGTYLTAFMNGWMLGTVNADIDAYLSHVQIHNPDFTANSDISAFFLKAPVTGRIEESLPAEGVSCRLCLPGMLASAGNAVGLTAKGVFPDDERAAFTIDEQIPDSLGSFLPDGVRMPIVISRKTAEKLKVGLRSKIVFTFQDVHGDMQSLAFRVSGIFRTTNSMFDESTAFVRYHDIFSVTGLPGGAVHEAGVRVAGGLDACGDAALQLKEMFPALSVRDWEEISPMLSMSLAMTGIFSSVILIIFLLALSFGIVNTMLMAVLERTRELGMLGAVGMSRRNIFRMIMLETLFLTLLGSIVGIVLGTAVILPSIRHGIDLTPLMGDTMEDYGFGSVIYPLLDAGMFVRILLLVLAAGMLSAIYPAKKALRMKPVEAIRK
jgi:ABC-type lipoprotein release transport system permease subunit